MKARVFKRIATAVSAAGVLVFVLLAAVPAKPTSVQLLTGKAVVDTIGIPNTQPGLLDKVRDAAPRWIAKKLPAPKECTVLSSPLKGGPGWLPTSYGAKGQSFE